MKTKLALALVLVAASIVGFLALSAKPKPAYCYGCSVDRCSGAYACGYGCHCVFIGQGTNGYCVGN